MQALDAKVPTVSPASQAFKPAFGKIPVVGKSVERATSVWERLLAAFCAALDPYLARFASDEKLVGVVTAGGAIELHHFEKAKGTAVGVIGSLDADIKSRLGMKKNRFIELRLRPEQVLARTLSLPEASRDFLGPIIEHRLDRLTPWRADKVLYGYRVADDAQEAPGIVSVALLAAPKEVVESLVRHMTDAGFPPTRIGAGAEKLDQPARVALNMQGSYAPRGVSRRIVSRVSLGVFASLVVVVAITSYAASEAMRDQQAIEGKLVKARVLLKGTTAANAGGREKTLLDAKVPDRSTVVLIDKLATAIPDGTYLKELAITSDKVRLVGTSSNTPELVGKLEEAGLSNVRFNAAITRDKDLRDSFEITSDRFVPAIRK
jgi:general secretion pathway protein L